MPSLSHALMGTALVAVAAAQAVPLPIAETPQSDYVLRIVLVAIGIFLGSAARLPSWFDEEDPTKFMWSECRRDISASGFLGLVAYALASYLQAGEALVAAGAGILAFLGIGALRDVLMDVVISRMRTWAIRAFGGSSGGKTGDPTP